MPDADTPRDAVDPRLDRDVHLTGSHADAAGVRPTPGSMRGQETNDDQPIDLLQYVRRLSRFLLPAAALGLITALAVAAVMGLSGSKPIYHTKAHVLVQPNTSNEAIATTQSQLSSQYMRTYVALGTADVITRDVSAALHGKYTPEQIGQMMQVYWGGGSLLLAIQATSTNHQDALDISEAGAKALVAHQTQLLNMSPQTAPHLVLVQDAFDDTPATTGGSGHLRGLVPGIGAGVVVTLLAAMVLQWLAGRRARRPHPATVAR